MSKQYKLHTDPSHGWLAVRRKELHELNIADKITRYSYQKGDTVYLEEDLDLATFFNAYRAKHGVDPVYTESYRERTFVRNCEPYTVDVTVTVKQARAPKRAKKVADVELTPSEAAAIRAEFNARLKQVYEAN